MAPRACRKRAANFTYAVALLALCLCSAEPALAENTALLDLFRKPASNSTRTVDHKAWSQLLARYVKQGADGLNRVDYAAFKRAGQPELKAYISRLEATDPRTLDRLEQFAFLANLYNAKTIDIVLDHYPVKSIKDISLGGGLIAAFTGGPWKANVLKIYGVDASLDDIEHGVLRQVFKDPRVHYAINCASVGCPNLGTEALTGAKLEQQLNAAAAAYINHSRGVTISNGQLFVSSIYTWFQSDFGGSEAGVLKHFKTYASATLAAKLKATPTIAGYIYDWNLNDVAK